MSTTVGTYWPVHGIPTPYLGANQAMPYYGCSNVEEFTDFLRPLGLTSYDIMAAR